jgi:polar amino acid transport system substrate-binding protein
MDGFSTRFWVSIILVASLLPVALHAQSAPSRDLKSVTETGVLRVAITKFNLPAFHRRSDGSLVGPEIDLANDIAGALGVKAEFVEDATSFDGVVDIVARGGADIGISKLSQTYDRLQHVRFSEPYVTLRHALLFERAALAARSEGRPPEEVLRQFNGRIGAIRRSAYVDFARRNFPNAQVVEMGSWEAAVNALLDHQVDAVYRDEFEIRRVLKNGPALNVHFGAAIIVDQKAFLSVAICDTCVKLQEFINYHILQTQGAITLQGLLSANLRD